MKVWIIRSHSFSFLTHELQTCSGNPSPSRTYNKLLLLVNTLSTVNAMKMAHNELGLFLLSLLLFHRSHTCLAQTMAVSIHHKYKI